jgi:predicted RNA-binding Zn-ribbon protein involved in translation (DUF1610 family)
VTATPASASPGSGIEVRGDVLGFDCPRCGADVSERFYGPCGPCRSQLASLGGDHREVDVARFEPRMHVTPNAVATKD